METKVKLTYDEKISTAVPIWSLLNMTEEEYTKKYAQKFNLDAFIIFHKYIYYNKILSTMQ